MVRGQGGGAIQQAAERHARIRDDRGHVAVVGASQAFCQATSREVGAVLYFNFMISPRLLPAEPAKYALPQRRERMNGEERVSEADAQGMTRNPEWNAG